MFKGQQDCKSDELVDLYAIHAEKIDKGIYSIHPYRWLLQEFKSPIGWVAVDLDPGSEVVIEIGGQRLESFREIKAYRSRNRMKDARRVGHYFASQNVARQYKEFEVDSSNLESAIIDRIVHQDIDVDLESSTQAGSIDCRKSDAIVEVKRIGNWKHALGQIIAYGNFDKNHRRSLHLFGKKENMGKQDVIKAVCEANNIRVVFETVDSVFDRRLPL